MVHRTPAEAGACLVAACDGGHADIVEAVLGGAGRAGRAGLRRERRRCLAGACRRGQAGVVLALLRGGADVAGGGDSDRLGFGRDASG